MAEIGIAAYLGEEQAIKEICLKKLKKKNALSKETAKTVEEIGINQYEMNTLKQLVKKGEVNEYNGRYYILCKDKKHC